MGEETGSKDFIVTFVKKVFKTRDEKVEKTE
jgi:hypothetical protein